MSDDAYFMADPHAYDPSIETVNRVAESLTREALDEALRNLWEPTLTPWGAPEFSWFRPPRRRLNLFAPRGLVARMFEESAWKELGRSAWIKTVRERLQSAVYAADSGYGWSWETPGVLGVPGQPEGVQVRDARQLWRPGGEDA